MQNFSMKKENNYMKFLPTPPTDNLYKYMAITGTWIMTGIVIGSLVIVYFDIRYELYYGNFIRKIRTEKNIREFDSAISSGNLGEFEIKKDDIPYLNSRISGLMKELEVIDKNLDGDKWISDVFGLFDKYYKLFFCIFFAFFVFGLSLTMYGYRNWYMKYQKKQDRLLEIELLSKENEIKNGQNNGG